MKKFLLLCVLFVACLAPGAEGADYPVPVANGENVKTRIDAILAPVVAGGTIPAANDTITVTIASGTTASITAAIPVPYTNDYDDGSGTGTMVTVSISTVNVQGGGTLQASGNHRLFDVAANGTATFTNVTLDGNNNAGGGVVTAGTTTFEGVTFRNNGHTTGVDGALIITAGTTTLNGTNTFTGNTSDTNGGAINLTAGTLTVGTSSTLNFETNRAANGGAIHTATALDLSNATVTFTGNSATANGGAIYTTGAVSLADATFGGTAINTAKAGGAIYAASVTATGTTTFTGNQATDGNGGAIYSTGAVSLASGTFTGNTATANGGAIYATGGVTMNTNAVAFTGNKATTDAGGSGGAIYSTGAVTLGTFVHNFDSNEAINSGGAIYTENALTVNGQKFTTNKATGANGNGGAIEASAAQVTVTTGTFDGNTATGGDGGAIHTTGTVQVDGGSFGETTKNTAAQGGAIDAGTANINGGTFKNNEATGTGGGAIYATTAKLTKTPKFESNSATAGDGGAIYATTVDLTGTPEFTNNTTVGNGGAIYAGNSVAIGGGTFATNKATTANTSNGGAVYSAGAVGITGGEFSSNEAINGGAVYATGKVTVSNPNSTTQFTTKNTAANNGGAIYSEGEIETSGTEFRSQTALYSGGALYAKGKVTVNSGAFYSNTTTNTEVKDQVGGGAIYSEKEVIVGAGAGDFSGNIDAYTATNDAVANTNSGGGAIHALGDVEINGGTFASNRSNSSGSKSGGGAVWSGGTVKVNGGSFASTSDTPNVAAGSGGGIYAGADITVDPSGNEDNKFIFSYQKAKSGGALFAGKDITAANTIFQSNEATDATTGDGGATFSDGKSSFNNCLFGATNAANKAKRNGGAVLAEKGLTATNCSFRDNQAEQSGGAISVRNSADNRIVKCVFDTNTGKISGGAIYEVGDDAGLTIEDTLFIGNITQGAGGAIVTSTGGAAPKSLILLRCTFQENTADRNGGALNADVQTFRITNCTFYGNVSTSGSGGALLLAGGTGGKSSLVFCTIANNKAASGNGGGIHSTATFSIGANIIAGNSASLGRDIYANDGAMTSLGFNFFAQYGEKDAASTPWDSATYAGAHNTDSESDKNTFDLFFGNGTTPARNDDKDGGGTDGNGNKLPPDIGASDPITTTDGLVERALNTLALRHSTEESDNPAQAIIPRSRGVIILNSDATDERHVPRPSKDGSKWDAGAYDTLEGENGSDPDTPEDEVGVYYIRISGLPNRLRTVGQTTSLFAVGYDIHNNLINRDVDVTWSSSSNAVVIYASGNIYSNHVGKATITASMKSNPSITDSVELTVTEEASDTDSNLHPVWWKRLGLQQLTDEGMSLAIASVSSTVKTAAFQDDFKSRWGINGSWVLNSESVVATSPTTVPARTDDLKPGVRLSISGMEKGNILPMEYSWTLDYDQLSKLLDRNVTSLPSAAELAKVMRIDFENLRSVRVPVIDGSNGGTFNVATAQFDKVGVSAVDAALTGALRVQQATNSATISLTVHLANVDDANNKGAQLVQRLLIVPDGVADNAISGTMWMSKKAESSSNNNNNNNNNNSNSGNGGGGGGGCDATGLGLAVLLLALPLLARRRR